MAVDNNCITITGVSMTTGPLGQGVVVVNQTVDFDVKLTPGQTQSANTWTLAINQQQIGGKPNPNKVHYTFTQSDMAQILTALNNIWSNQPS